VQDSGKAHQMPLDALTAATVLKAISDHRWTDAAKWPIVAA